ncbi:GMC oxidoreductase [Parapedobacter lycopersici]|uniref:GMC oxidoreductase n=1 Tax=Parapedobacter lycopersici TaxID=1864939 RepID=UPI00214DC01E|nr:GMC family oxidoreductase [Parapedobacter lycopersici]
MNIKSAPTTYDAIVVGSGISGGWAAKELCEMGLKTLVLERGRDVKHIADYTTALMNPWDFKYGLENTIDDQRNNPVQSTSYDAGDKHFFVRDQEHPYIQETPFNWIRGYQVGGRSLTWGRQCYRWSDLDFAANGKEGIGVDWPIRYRDLAPWYDYVEAFVGVSGQSEGLAQLPDGIFQPPMELNCIEQHLKAYIKKDDARRVLTIARVANLTKPVDGRGLCLNRNLCSRGCPYGGYFSSNSATLPAAAATGNLTLHPHAIVMEILYDDAGSKATGVRVMDAVSMEVTEYYARIIFLNASTIATAAILLNSKSGRFPDGLGNDSGELGRNLMDHHSYAGAYGVFGDKMLDKYYKGRRPSGFIIPRFRNLEQNEGMGFLRGYGIQGHGERQEWGDRSNFLNGFGKSFKDQLTKPGPWTIWMAGWGECLPYPKNRVTLDVTERDKWGMPLVRISFSYGENERVMMGDIEETTAEMLEKAGFEDVYPFNYNKPGGSTIHEMGTARMGADPETSVLNRFNQIHSVKNIFVTDGSCMTSSGSQNPSLTYMALTARACHYAASEMKKGNL